MGENDAEFESELAPELMADLAELIAAINEDSAAPANAAPTGVELPRIDADDEGPVGAGVFSQEAAVKVELPKLLPDEALPGASVDGAPAEVAEVAGKAAGKGSAKVADGVGKGSAGKGSAKVADGVAEVAGKGSAGKAAGKGSSGKAAGKSSSGKAAAKGVAAKVADGDARDDVVADDVAAGLAAGRGAGDDNDAVEDAGWGAVDDVGQDARDDAPANDDGDDDEFAAQADDLATEAEDDVTAATSEVDRAKVEAHAQRSNAGSPMATGADGMRDLWSRLPVEITPITIAAAAFIALGALLVLVAIFTSG